MESPRLRIDPYDFAAARAIESELGLSHTVAQVLLRRGHDTPEAARAWLAADAAHDFTEFDGLDESVDLILGHVEAQSRITIHGDYDVDGVCSTAVLVRALRALGATVDWYLPSRIDDGYGLSLATVERLRVRGTELLITVDCAITAVDEVAAARAAGLDVVVTDHHRPREDGVLPDAPIVHPLVCGYPCPDLCATAVAHKLAEALDEVAGGMAAAVIAEDLDLVALATVADCVPLHGENRRLVREGLRVLAATGKPGLRTLMRITRTDPSLLDAKALGFRLAPRINAAGRLHRADAGLELLLTTDEERAQAVAEELDRANAERRHVEQRILFAAEAQVREMGERPAYVLAGEDWHPGVIGIVASRIAERHCRPAVLIALDGDEGTCSGRSIPAFDLLGGLGAAKDHLIRWGGHRAAAGATVARSEVDAFRAAFEAHAAEVLAPEDLVPVERVDAIAPGDALNLALAEELASLGPFGTGNPDVRLLLRAVSLTNRRTMGEDNAHVRFTVASGATSAAAVAFRCAGRLAVPEGVPADATFSLEVNSYNGSQEAQLILCSARPADPPPLDLLGEPADFVAAAFAACDAPPASQPPEPAGGDRTAVDRRGGGLAGTISDLVAGGQQVLVVCADARRRARHCAGRLGGFAMVSYAALEADPALATRFDHVVALDPPATEAQSRAVRAGTPLQFIHLAWGAAELRFAAQIHEHEYGLRTQLAAVYRDLRAAAPARGEELEAVLRGDPERPRSAALAGRLLKVLEELGLVSLDRDLSAVSVPPAERTELEKSAAFRAYSERLEDGQRYLSEARARAA
jgi:single-stranded-DNA-specific exonuclease